MRSSPTDVVVNLGCECDYLFGGSDSIRTIENGVFSAPFKLPVPEGAVVLVQNSAKHCKQCVPKMVDNRVTITFRTAPRR